MLLHEKYAPSSLNDFVGNRLGMEKLKRFGASIQSGKKVQPIIVYGPSGTGKTAAVRTIATSNGYELVELTSSDYRDADTLRKKLLPAVSSRGLFSKVTLILFDEIDELSSKFDKGAESAILEILKNAKQPIAFTAGDFWDQRISFLRNHTDKVEFKKVDTKEIMEYLRKIASKEGAKPSEDTLREISYRSDGDVRGALNDLQMVLIDETDIMDSLGVRNRKLEIFRVLDRIFMTNNFSNAKSAVDTSDIDLSMLINWVDENIPNRYTSKQAVNKAYGELAFASRFFEMAERVRYYGYIKYAASSLAGVSISSGGNMKYLTPYAFPSKIKYLGSTKGARGAQNKIAAKFSLFLHTNRHEIVASYLPMFKNLFGKMDAASKQRISESLEDDFKLEEEEVAYFFGAN